MTVSFKKMTSSLPVNGFAVVAVLRGGPEIVALVHFLCRKCHFVELAHLAKYNFLLIGFVFCFFANHEPVTVF